MIGRIMDIEVREFNKNDTKKWDQYVIQSNDSSFYHQIGWKAVVEGIYGHRSFYLYAEDDDGNVIGILPTFLIDSFLFGKRMVSIPFAPYGGLCCKDVNVGKKLLDSMLCIGNDLNVKEYEFRGSPFSLSYDFTSNSFYKSDYSQYVTFHKDLSNGIGYMWDHIDRKARNLVRKASKNNLSFEILNYSRSNVRLFYEIYLENMKSLGTPVHSFEFFDKLGETFPEDVFISSVELSNTVIASLYLIRFKDCILSGWGASLDQYLKYAPNNFIYWKALRWASEKEYSYFDFGRSELNSGNYFFKQKWRGNEIPLKYSCFSSSKLKMKDADSYKSFCNVWKKIPLPLTRVLGPCIRKNIV